jgi:3-oxoacyl-[acyl-carrier protein] reductase
MNQLDMKGRHAVVTGGATGLGYAIAERMVASGARVTLWDRDIGGMGSAAEKIKAEFPQAQVACVPVDVSRHADVAQAVAQSVAISPVDAMVNCAGVSGPNVKLWDYGVDDWQHVMNVNINGVFFGCREMVPHMRERRYGRIVNIASVAGKEGNPNASAYSTSKAAVIGLTKSLGKELAELDIKVNCVTPAAVKTAIFDQMSEQHIQFMLSKIPMGRFGTPEEIAAMVVWLCTEECSFTTGAVFDLSGGRATY